VRLRVNIHLAPPVPTAGPRHASRRQIHSSRHLRHSNARFALAVSRPANTDTAGPLLIRDAREALPAAIHRSDRASAHDVIATVTP
jgi:hypothetical protein